jgi:hypothetical protein
MDDQPFQQEPVHQQPDGDQVPCNHSPNSYFGDLLAGLTAATTTRLNRNIHTATAMLRLKT